jgi:hypothetical protein
MDDPDIIAQIHRNKTLDNYNKELPLLEKCRDALIKKVHTYAPDWDLKTGSLKYCANEGRLYGWRDELNDITTKLNNYEKYKQNWWLDYFKHSRNNPTETPSNPFLCPGCEERELAVDSHDGLYICPSCGYFECIFEDESYYPGAHIATRTFVPTRFEKFKNLLDKFLICDPSLVPTWYVERIEVNREK